MPAKVVFLTAGPSRTVKIAQLEPSVSHLRDLDCPIGKDYRALRDMFLVEPRFEAVMKAVPAWKRNQRETV